MKRISHTSSQRKSIFRSLFAPLLLLMVLQAVIFYFAAVYGGIEESLSQNAADVLSERLYNRKYELETRFNNQWTNLDACSLALGNLYADYAAECGGDPFRKETAFQIDYLSDAATLLIDTLRQNDVNGVFLILNDKGEQAPFPEEGTEAYGLCIRDMDQSSNYTFREDLLVERAPSSIIDTLGCPLDSWWEAKYTFSSQEEGDYYYAPLNAAWEHPGAKGSDLMYCSGTHQISGSDPAMISCSIPLTDQNGRPYGVLGVEISVKHLSSLLPNRELNEPEKCCYVLAIQDAGVPACSPILGTGSLYSRCFVNGSSIPLSQGNATGGFDVTGRGNVALYGDVAQLNIYNNNSPFETRQLALLAFVERDTLFAYIDRIKLTLLMVSLLSLMLGIGGLLLTSKRFAAPITALARRVRGMETQPDFQLERVGILEIDQLVDAIEELNRNVGKGSARAEFFSRMSHDMRTPMNAIISFSSPELLEGADETVKDDYLEKIHASGEYLLGLINEVLDMTKIESNKTELRFTAVQADGLFTTTIPIIEELAQKKGLTFTVELPASPELYVTADVQHINQIVMNLLSNAVKFTPEGGAVGLRAALSSGEGPGGEVRCQITVWDSGIGMSPAFMKRLYTPFEQENGRGEGTGLGLSIARKLVELMGGTIRCVSKQGRGTTFTVTLPLSISSAPQPDAPASRAAGRTASDGSLAGKRVLICEDNAINRLIVQRLLEKWQIRTEHAENGRAGVELFAASPANAFDAILMDVQMPVMDGLAAARAIRALDRPDAATVPIIAMTANAFQEDEEASKAAGMNVHLAKPIEPVLLFSALSGLMGNWPGKN